MLTSLEKRMDEHEEKFNKETESIRKYQTEVIRLKNTTEKYTTGIQ